MAKRLIAFCVTTLLLIAVADIAVAGPIVVGSGFSTGTFVASAPCDFCAGLGTSTFRWGDPVPGSFQHQFTFVGVNPFTTSVGSPFNVGVLTFGNGANLGQNPEWVDLAVETHSTDPVFDNEMTIRVNFYGTVNTDDRLASADYVSVQEFPNNIGPGAFRVFEDQAGAVYLKAVIGSLDLVGFGEVLTPETAFLTATTDPNDLTPVPEPSTVLLLLGGLAAIRMSKGVSSCPTAWLRRRMLPSSARRARALC